MIIGYNMSGNSIGTGSYSSTPDWDERYNKTKGEFNDGIKTSRKLAFNYGKVAFLIPC